MTKTVRGKVVHTKGKNGEPLYFVRPDAAGKDIFIPENAYRGMRLRKGDELEVEFFMASRRTKDGKIEQGPRAAKVRRVDEAVTA